MSEVENGNPEIEYITSNFTSHKFSAVISERKIIYQVFKMTDSVLVFINEKENMQLGAMVLSLLTRYDNQPVATRLFGAAMDEASKSISLKMAKRLNKAVYVSCNMEDDRIMVPLVEKRLFEEIKDNPNMF